MIKDKLRKLINKKDKSHTEMVELKRLCKELGCDDLYDEFIIEIEDRKRQEESICEYKVSSYFKNAEIFGTGMDVAGGIDIAHLYRIEILEDKRISYIVLKDGTVTLRNDLSQCTYVIWQVAEKIRDDLEKMNIRGRIRVIPKAISNQMRGL